MSDVVRLLSSSTRQGRCLHPGLAAGPPTQTRMACDVDTGAVFKHPVHCIECDQTFYFTLRKIAEAQKLVCPLCGSDINLTDEAYGFVVTSRSEEHTSELQSRENL